MYLNLNIKRSFISLAAFALLAFAVLVAGQISGALAQTTNVPQQIIPEPIAPPQNPVDLPNLGISGGMTMPDNAAEISLKLLGVTLQNLPQRDGIDVAELSQLWQPLIESDQISLADIYKLAGKIEQTLVNAGYPLMRVTVPPQTLDQDGATIQLMVIDGQFISINDEAVPESQRALLRRYLTPLLNRPGLENDEIERRILLASSLSGLRVRSGIAAVDEASDAMIGASQLVVLADYQPINASYGIDNMVPDPYGGQSQTLVASVNSALGFGERFTVAAGGKLEPDGLWAGDSPRKFQQVSLYVPIGSSGLTANAEYQIVTGKPEGDLSDESLRLDMQRYNFRLTYPLVRQRRQNLTLSGGLSLIDDKLFTYIILPESYISHDELSVFEARLHGNRCMIGEICVDSTISFRRGLDMFGARGQAEAAVNPDEPLTIAAGDNVFNAIEADAKFSKNLDSLPNHSWQMDFGFGYGFNESLLSSQHFSPIGDDRVSGFVNAPSSGDKGWWTRGQWNYQYNPSNLLNGQLYGFAAGGKSYLEAPTAAEQDSTYAASAGIGVENTIQAGAPVSVFIKSELARLWTDDPSVNDKYGFMLSLSLRY